MSDKPKTKIKASEIVSDIRSGMSEPELKQKYGLRQKSLEQALGKLSAAGLLTDIEIQKWNKSNENYDLRPRPEVRIPQWRCPSCNAPQPEEKDECPVCGVVIKKLLSHREHDFYMPPTSETSTSQGKGWLAVVASIIVFAIVGTGFLWWSKHRATEKTRVAGLHLKLKTLDRTEAAQNAYQSSSGQDEPSNSLSSEGTDSGASNLDLSPGSAPPQEATSDTRIRSKEDSRPKEKEPISSKYRYRSPEAVQFQRLQGRSGGSLKNLSSNFPVLQQVLDRHAGGWHPSWTRWQEKREAGQSSVWCPQTMSIWLGLSR